MLKPTPVAQPVQALGVANARRTAVAELKTRLRQRTLSLREIIEHPPEEIARQMTWEVLLWAPGMGRTKLRTLNARAMRDRPESAPTGGRRSVEHPRISRPHRARWSRLAGGSPPSARHLRSSFRSGNARVR